MIVFLLVERRGCSFVDLVIWWRASWFFFLPFFFEECEVGSGDVTGS